MSKKELLPTIKEGKTGTKMRTKFQAPISKGKNEMKINIFGVVLVFRTKTKVYVFQAFFVRFKKKTQGQKKIKKSLSPKKIKGHFEQKTQCFGVTLRFPQKTKEMLTI